MSILVSRLIPLLLAASILTALRTIARSGGIIVLQDVFREEAFLFDMVLRRSSSLLWHNRNRRFLLANSKDHPTFPRTKYTFDSFVVANGIDLASFGLLLDNETITANNNNNSIGVSSSNNSNNHQQHHEFEFELFQDFDLSHQLKGNESWIELLEYRRDATHPSLSFYVDKVAFKRWLVTSYANLRIDTIKSFFLKYAGELYSETDFLTKRLEREKEKDESPSSSSGTTRGILASRRTTAATTTAMASWNRSELLSDAIRTWIPSDEDYVAKPTHLSCSGGVWLVHIDSSTNETWVGDGKKKLKGYPAGATTIQKEVSDDLASNLETVQEKCGSTVLESYALRHVRPGIVVEERFIQPMNDIDDDDFDCNDRLLEGGMEFKVFTIWGRAWLTVWRPGMDGVKALFHRDGSNFLYDPPIRIDRKTGKAKPPKPVQVTPLPDWIDWEQIIRIAETLGRHKDMFRTDIFVGVSSSDSSSDAIRYVVSETEIHPTPLRGFEDVFAEAGRLWLAGYYVLTQRNALRVVPNTEVPRSFFKQ